MPPVARTADSSQGSISQQSKENTPMPDIPSQTQSSTETQTTSKTGLGISGSSSSYQDTRSLADAFNLFTRYGDEFMDENPLQGEPGSFILSRNGGENDRAGANKTTMKSAAPVSVHTPVPGRVSTPQVRVDTPGKASDKSISPPSSGGDKGKRKKNRVAS